jgi:hypothetical protein
MGQGNNEIVMHLLKNFVDSPPFKTILFRTKA